VKFPLYSIRPFLSSCLSFHVAFLCVFISARFRDPFIEVISISSSLTPPYISSTAPVLVFGRTSVVLQEKL
jgi:hypothetical protein